MNYPIVRVAAGADPDSVLEAMFRHPSGQHIYVPNLPGARRTFDDDKLVGENRALSHINHEWIQKFHQEHPDYELTQDRRNTPVKPEMGSVDPHDPEGLGRHHMVYGELRHKTSGDRVGEFGFSLARWPLVSSIGKHSNVVTAHIHSIFRQRDEGHEHMMTNMLDSYLNHAKANGVHHAYVNEDCSHGYWLKQVTRHPDLVWGGVEFKELRGTTSNYQHIASRTHRLSRTPDTRSATLIRKRQDLFRGWPGFGESMSQYLNETDAFVMRWNKIHPKPEVGIGGHAGPLPTHLMRFDKLSTRKVTAHYDKACYHHAVRNARRNPNLRMAIGFMAREDESRDFESKKGPAPLMYTHAFNVNQHGEVHDSTLGSDPQNNRMRYYGYVVPHEVAKGFKSGTDLADWFGQHFQHGHDRGPSPLHLGQMKDIDHRGMA